MSEVTEVVRTSSRALAGSDAAVLVLRDADGLRALGDPEQDARAWGAPHRGPAALARRAVDGGRAVVIADLTANFPGFDGSGGVRSAAAMPFGTPEPMGAVVVGWKRPHEPAENEIKELEALARAAATAIQTVRLLDERERALQNARRAAAENGELLRLATRRLEELKNAQAELVQAQRLESVARLAGGAAHDFNNALTAIFCQLDLALADPAAAAAHGRLKDIRTAAEHASSVTRQLLSFARTHSPTARVVDPAELARETLPMIRALVGDSVRVELESAAGVWPVMADATQLQQVLMNLAANARDAMPGGGELTIRVEGRRTPTGLRTAVITVSDTGCGLDESSAMRIFEPFFTTKPPGAGTGLGLPTSLGIIERHGGAIMLDSKKGQGTRVEVTLPHAEDSPLRGAATPEPQPAPRAQGPQRAPVVLVVDDQPVVREAAAAVLRHAGCRVLEADSAAAALELAKSPEQELDVLLTDVVMPEMSGVELATALRAKRPTLRVLLSSGYPTDHRPGGASDFRSIPKPYSANDLMEAVRRVLA